MNDVAIRVENLSKRYRIGVQEEKQDTLVGTMLAFLKRPGRNLQRLRRLTRFSDNGADEKDIVWALRDVSFEVKQGEVIGVIGRNGAGKSTLLKILSRITYPTTGRVELHGRVSSLLEVGTGFHPELTGRENVYLNGTILGMRKKEIDKKFDEIVAFSNVETFIDTPVKHYSSGMRVRLAFSVAAHLEPEILLVDEVLAVGDAEFQKKCLGKMEDVSNQGRTILFVSHSMSVILNLCQNSIWVEKGVLKSSGATSEIVHRYLAEGTVRETVTLDRHKGRPDSAIPLMRQLRLMSNGRITATFVTGQPFQFEVQYSLGQIKISNLSLGFIITDGAGNNVTSANMNQYNSMVQSPEQIGTFYASVDSLPLTPGTYSLSLFLGDGGQDLDVIKNATYFDVLWDSSIDLAYPPRPNWGSVFMPVAWNYTK